ncbi:MAG: hypothetical protein J2P44_03520, partial [Candidatus Dormibacteraeota bacterium]|nr:hypothetical protein [Candidatus Dormibacteraeota bacterium]
PEMSTEEDQARERMRRRHADELRRAVKAAVAKAREAEGAASWWSDDFRQDAEQRLGVGATDEQALDDPVCDAALDVYSEVRKLREQADRALAAWERAQEDAALTNPRRQG